MKLVKCLDSKESEFILKSGKIYIVLSEGPTNYILKGMEDKGSWWFKHRFVEIKGKLKILKVLYEIT